MLSKMKILIIVCSVFLISGELRAQDDLLNMIDDPNARKPTPVYATFKSTRVVNMQSNETVKARHLDFRIQHRFGPVKNGAYDLFGLDGATIRLSLEYGILDRVMVGIGRSTSGKTYDGFVKAKLLQQKKNGTPVGLTVLGSTAINTLTWEDPTRNNFFSSRLAYCGQILITRKVNDHLSLLVAPTLVHYNLVPNSNTPNDIYAIGLGTSIKISRSTRFNIEYIPRLNGRSEPKLANGDPMYNDAIAFGFDIETGGHVFQLHFTNATGMIEQQFVGRNMNPLGFTELRFGFNISRTFSFDSGGKKW
jgi:hypothetical protein